MLGALSGGGNSVGPMVVGPPPCGAGRRMRSLWKGGGAKAAGCGAWADSGPVGIPEAHQGCPHLPCPLPAWG